MDNYWTEILIDVDSIQKLSLPCDLYRFKLVLKDEIKFEFINFIESLSNKSGYYFNSHFMHERVKINDILVSKDLMTELLFYSEAMKSITVVNDVYLHRSRGKVITLIDKIVIDNQYFYDMSSKATFPLFK